MLLLVRTKRPKKAKFKRLDSFISEAFMKSSLVPRFPEEDDMPRLPISIKLEFQQNFKLKAPAILRRTEYGFSLCLVRLCCIFRIVTINTK